MENKVGRSIKKLRNEKGYTQTQLAEKIQLSKQGIIKIENGTSNPNSSTITKLAEVFEVTPNEILGIYYTGIPFNYQTSIARNIRTYRENAEMTTEVLAKQTDLTTELINEIEEGYIMPSLSTIEKIADILNIGHAELTEANQFQRSIKEVELMKAVDKRKNILEEVSRLLNGGSEHLVDADGKEVSAYEQAQVKIIEHMNLKEKSLDELMEILDYLYEKEIFELVKKF